MKEEYNRFFDRVTPRMSDEELFGAVLRGGKEHNMENNKKASSKKRRLAPAVATVVVAATVATTAGAVSTYYQNVNEEYNDVLAQNAEIFPQPYTDKDGNAVDQKDKTEESGIYEKLNIEINKMFELEKFTLEVPGAISDGKDIYIMYNVIFDEDPWSGNNPWFEENEGIFLEGAIDSGGVEWGWKLGMGTISKHDGKTVYSSYFSLDGIENCVDDTVKVSFDSLWGTNMMLGEEYHFNAEIEIPISDDLAKFNKTIDVSDTPYVKAGNWGNWDFVQIKVTPLGVTFNLKTDGETPDPKVCKDYRPNIPVYVNFKDDTTLNLTRRYTSQGIDKENKTLQIQMMFNYPVDVNDIKSIQFASALVNMNGGVTTVDCPELEMWN